jgi:hypothetical protein
MAQLNHRGWVAIILASALGVVLVVIAIAISLGVAVTEVGRTAAWALIGALAGALVTYLTSATSNGSKPPTKKFTRPR